MDEQIKEVSEMLERNRDEADAIEGDPCLRDVLSQTFEGLLAIAGNKTEDLKFQVQNIAHLRTAAQGLDTKMNDDPLRIFYYGINGAVEKAMEAVLARNSLSSVRPPSEGDEMGEDPLMPGHRQMQFAGVGVEPNGMGFSYHYHQQQQSGNQAYPNFDEKWDTLECPRCESAAMRITTFVKHLKDVHRKTPGEAKVAFACSCGLILTNSKTAFEHTKNCPAGYFKIVDRPDTVM